MGRKAVAILLVLVLVMAVVPAVNLKSAEAVSKTVETSGAEGIHFYYDKEFTREISPYIDLRGEYEASYPGKIAVSRTTGAKAYLRVLDGENKYKVTGNIIDLYNYDCEKMSNIGDYVRIDEMPKSVEGDKRYELTFLPVNNYEYLNVLLNRGDLRPGNEEWYETTEDTGIVIDYVDEGLNISDRADAIYNRFIGEGESFGGYFLELENLEYSAAYATVIPDPDNLGFVSFACFEGGELKAIKDASKLSVYKSDGITKTDDLLIESYTPTGYDESAGMMTLGAMPGVTDGEYVIRYDDGKTTYDMKVSVGLPTVGIYKAPVRSLENLVTEFNYTEGVIKKYYILTDRTDYNEISYDYITYGDDGVSVYAELHDSASGDGFAGTCMDIDIADADGPLKFITTVKYEDNGHTVMKKGAAFAYVNPAKMGLKKVVDGNIYKITKLYSDKGLGTVTLVKASKNRTGDHIKYTVTIAGHPYYITAIGPNAYKGNKKLKSMIINEQLKTIGKNAFKNCTALKSVRIYSKAIKKVGKAAFKGLPKKCVMRVPASKVKAYKKLFKKAGFNGKVKKA